MSQLADLVEIEIRARRLFRRGQAILVGVSGGVDSVVLLHVLQELSGRNGWRLTVAHFNHRLRGRSSDADERLVRQTGRKLKLPVVVGRARVRQLARARGLSLEMAARSLRHDFLARTAARLRIPSVALAHHADDKVELFFLRLLRGSGGEGLAGMRWHSASPSDREIELARPLLKVSKSVLRRYAAEMRIRFREDASNALLNMQRNRIRHELLPLLRRKYQPALDEAVLRLMDIVGAEAEVVTQSALEWMRAGQKVQNPKSEIRNPKFVSRNEFKSCEILRFGRLPVAVQRRCLQLQLQRLGVEVDFALVERLRLKPGTPVSVKGTERQVVCDANGRLRLDKAQSLKFKAGFVDVDFNGGAGRTSFDGVGVEWQVITKGGVGRGENRFGREFFDAGRVGSRILLRHWQPGDRFQPIGMKCAVKLQDFFTNRKVPVNRRREVVVGETAAGEIFWVEGMRISEQFKLTRKTIRRLQWQWQRL